MPHLSAPDVRFRASFVAAMAEFAVEGRGGDGSMVGADLATYGERWQTDTGFGQYVADVLAEVDGRLQPGRVASTTLWWVKGEDYLGRIAVRHELTRVLLEVGGHIGYDVRRSRRREGHATAMLRAVLPVAHGIGIDPALVTCDHDNVASRKTIESAGGVLEDRRGTKLRFWVPTG